MVIIDLVIYTVKTNLATNLTLHYTILSPKEENLYFRPKFLGPKFPIIERFHCNFFYFSQFHKLTDLPISLDTDAEPINN